MSEAPEASMDEAGQEDQGVVVGAVTIGALLPVNGVWMEIIRVEDTDDGQEIVLKPRFLTSAHIKRMVRDIPKHKRQGRGKWKRGNK